jgi:hypothetical protein
MAPDSKTVFERATRAYEFGRARHAAVLALPLTALAILAACLGTEPVTAGMVGLALLATAWFLRWRGQILGRSIIPGILAGLVPFALAASSRAYGHVCTGSECVSLCIPACTVGGVVAGFLIARAGRHAAARTRYLVGASANALLVGSLGCSCVGYGGILGLGAGLLVSLLPASLRARSPIG